MESLESESGSAYSLIRAVRKISWMDVQVRSKSHRYHRKKAARALTFTQKRALRLSGSTAREFKRVTALGDWIAARFTNEREQLRSQAPEPIPLPARIHSEYWGFELGPEWDPADRAILLSIVPDSYFHAPEAARFASEVRKAHPRLSLLFQQIALIEAFRLRAWARAQIEIPEWYEEWQRTLDRWGSKTG